MASNNIALCVLLFLAVLQATMCAILPADQFKDKIHGNLTKVTWAHAVNSKAELNDALQNKSTMMLEADVMWGKRPNDTEDIPVMGHPSLNSSNLPTFDLSLNEFLDQVIANGQKGIKLDFKSVTAIEPSVKILQGKKLNVPLFLNADILQGPSGLPPTIKIADFQNMSIAFPDAILSLGWTTFITGVPKGEKGYKESEITEMITTITTQKNKTQYQNPITYPVRAVLAFRTADALWEKLLNETQTSKYPNTLTIWTYKDDVLEESDLKNGEKLIAKLGRDRVYLDLPPKEFNRLNSAATATLCSFLLIGAIAVNFLMAAYN